MYSHKAMKRSRNSRVLFGAVCKYCPVSRPIKDRQVGFTSRNGQFRCNFSSLYDIVVALSVRLLFSPFVAVKGCLFMVFCLGDGFRGVF
jgi:hypothetical protein